MCEVCSSNEQRLPRGCGPRLQQQRIDSHQGMCVWPRGCTYSVIAARGFCRCLGDAPGGWWAGDVMKLEAFTCEVGIRVATASSVLVKVKSSQQAQTDTTHKQ
ncbi:hypothetical protein L6452_37037 [Arctium lappa]|uniref:Uncharacterized protein n=1 Tax=Arctium lappa TaxID=4217 RepID=A0ACB8Y2D0_ARCLA|nr:hypothetical protein L6452_37037 [Arctium lappa]